MARSGNLYTADAFHVVETKRLEYIPYSEDIEVWYSDLPLKFTIDDEYDTWYENEVELIEDYWNDYKNEDCPIKIKTLSHCQFDKMIDIDGDEVYISSFDDYFKAYGVEIRGTAWEKYNYEPVAFFFILDEAKRYIQYQRHNLCSPRTYTYSAGYANYGDFVPFRNLLLSIGEKLNKEDK